MSVETIGDVMGAVSRLNPSLLRQLTLECFRQGREDDAVIFQKLGADFSCQTIVQDLFVMEMKNEMFSKASLQIIKFLTEHGADINSVFADSAGLPELPILSATKLFAQETIEFFVSHETIDLNVRCVRDRSSTPLSIAVLTGNMKLTRVLLRAEPNLDLRYHFGHWYNIEDHWHTLLCHCTDDAEYSIVKKDIVRLLLVKGADPYACECSRPIKIELIETVWGKRDSLHFAVLLSRKNTESYQLFLSSVENATKAEINLQDAQGWSALHVAAFWNCQEAFLKLCEKGADLNTQTKMGLTAITIAANKGYYGIVSSLRT